MRDDVLGLGEQIADALWKVESAGLPSRQSAGLAIAGMGGSAIGGRLAAAAVGPRARRPIVTVTGFGLPSWIDESWTVLCSSYSGRTPETLGAYDAARDRGTTLVAATTGGELAERAREDGTPVIPVAGGFQPRAAVGYGLTAAMEVAALCGAAPSLRHELEAAAAGVGEDERAAPLAGAIGDAVPVFHGAELTAAVAYRWKSQVNENASSHAFFSELPEAAHNEVEAWEPAGPLAAVFLDDPDTDPRTRERLAALREIAGGGEVVEGRGASRTERLVDLVVLGDLVSLELAARRGVDPGTTPALDRLKAQVSRA